MIDAARSDPLRPDARGDGLPEADGLPPQEVMSVSEVTSRVKEHLESRFADVWVAGEISNLVRAEIGRAHV